MSSLALTPSHQGGHHGSDDQCNLPHHKGTQSVDLVCAGIYRVILDERRLGQTVCVLISPEDQKSGIGGRNKKPADQLKRRRKKPRHPLVGKLIWMDRSELQRLSDEHLLKPISVERAVITTLNRYNKKEYDRNIIAMALFLDIKKLHECIVVHAGIGALVSETTKTAKVSRFYVYKHWSNLCRFGLDEQSLIPQRRRCGAPGIKRPCNPPAEGLPDRKKAGRKTIAQRNARHFGEHIESKQPGMTLEWTAAILAADKQIPTPKPRWLTRCDNILTSAFCGKAKEQDGKIVLVKPELGTYPTIQQMKRVLTVEKTQLERVIERTAKRHFTRNMRGIVGRNWEGVSGPGHTWAIDSTVADIYLRSGVNRAWVVGRPIVYLVVDVWSTAIVGFYVCLTGPSWDTAKISLFNAAADPTLVAEMWGYQPMLSLYPAPALPYELLCDRGEYLSAGQRSTAQKKLLPLTSYTPPYAGDLKGLVEVLHRIGKDAQFRFMPGALDHRRKELELSGVDPASCVLTLREYAQYLYLLFNHYNLHANRENRLDAHMIGADIYPSPAGLWNMGHLIGVGYGKKVEEMDLITELLPDGVGRVRRDTIRYAGCDFISDEVKEAQWTAIARNCGGWNVPINYYPGSMSNIWTPNTSGSGLLRLGITDQSRASGELTLEEWLDAKEVQAMRRSDQEHLRRMASLDLLDNAVKLRANAIRDTKEAIAIDSGVRPTITEARQIEVAVLNHPSQSEAKVSEEQREEAMRAHTDMIRKLTDDATFREDDHEAA